MARSTVVHSHSGILCNCKDNKDDLYELRWSDFWDTLLSEKKRMKYFIVCLRKEDIKNTYVSSHLTKRNTGRKPGTKAIHRLIRMGVSWLEL